MTEQEEITPNPNERANEGDSSNDDAPNAPAAPSPSLSAAPPPIAPPPISSMPAEPPVREVARDDHGRITEPVDCRGCGYNLQGLPPDGVCPECSTPIERSIRGDVLQFANPEWLEKVSRGMLWIIVGIICQIGIGLLGGIGLSLMMSATAGPGGAMTFNTTGLAIVTLLTTAAGVVFVLGVWWMTTPESATIERERPFSARRMARFCSLFLIVQGPAQMFANPAAMMMGSGGTAPVAGGIVTIILIMAIVAVAAQVITLVGYIAGLVYLRSLAMRMPRPSLASQTKLVAWGFGVSNSVGLLFGALMLALVPTLLAGMAPGGGAPTANSLLAVLGVAVIGGCVVGVVNLVFSIWALVLLFIYRSRLAFIAEIARTNWYAQPSAVV